MQPNQDQVPQTPVQPEVPAYTEYGAPQDSFSQDYESPVDELHAEGPTPLPAIEPVQWQAVEYIQHDKSPLWYVGFAAVILVLMVAAILLSAWTFAVLIPVMAVALMVYSHRPPRDVNYTVSEKGLYINDQLHPMGEFKSFGVVEDFHLYALVLVPVKRFRPGLTVYFPSEAGEAIVDLLGSYIPMKEFHPDAFDRIVQKLRI